MERECEIQELKLMQKTMKYSGTILVFSSIIAIIIVVLSILLNLATLNLISIMGNYLIGLWSGYITVMMVSRLILDKHPITNFKIKNNSD